MGIEAPRHDAGRRRGRGERRVLHIDKIVVGDNGGRLAAAVWAPILLLLQVWPGRVQWLRRLGRGNLAHGRLLPDALLV